jgi:methyltransferase (TIGR00027 family)
MEAGKPSISAMGSAVLRAAHVREDPAPWVFEDLLAESLLTEDQVVRIEDSMARWPPAVRAGFRLNHAVRARVAEDAVVEGLQRAYVVLGAGLDTFAWRHPRAGELDVFELDHPDTQRWKRFALDRAGLSEPAHVHFVPVDLSMTRLAQVETPSAAIWNWLGVTMYLTRRATTTVLGEIARGGPGTTLVVNFLLADRELDDLVASMQSTIRPTLEAIAEPIVSSYTRREVSELLREAGFNTTELLDGQQLSGRYFPGRSDLTLPHSTLIAVASVEEHT